MKKILIGVILCLYSVFAIAQNDERFEIIEFVKTIMIDTYTGETWWFVVKDIYDEDGYNTTEHYWMPINVPIVEESKAKKKRFKFFVANEYGFWLDTKTGETRYINCYGYNCELKSIETFTFGEK
ncbi:MAG: hypothetical protein IIX03_01285 [Paludibacteraceae bacterium]|nr:hypothetical protein [Paludibacteraceae bacterium]